MKSIIFAKICSLVVLIYSLIGFFAIDLAKNSSPILAFVIFLFLIFSFPLIISKPMEKLIDLL